MPSAHTRLFFILTVLSFTLALILISPRTEPVSPDNKLTLHARLREMRACGHCHTNVTTGTTTRFFDSVKPYDAHSPAVKLGDVFTSSIEFTYTESGWRETR